MNKITLVIPYYNQPKMLDDQISQMVKSYSSWTQNHLHLIIVDDGSPEPMVNLRTFPFWNNSLINLRQFRIALDVPWNWSACRNLAAIHADGWILFTDIDHLVPDETLRALIQMELDKSQIYSFKRKNLDGADYKKHWNTFLIHRSTFNEIGGYDERIWGVYAAHECDFKERSAKYEMVHLDLYIVRVTSNDVADASTTLDRNIDFGMAELARAKKTRNEHWKPLALSYPWREL